MQNVIFNSLGSNYTPELVALANTYKDKPHSGEAEVTQKVSDELSKVFGGHSVFVYKGRDAIELVCRPLAEATTEKVAVLTQGLACHAIEEGMLRAGVMPVYVDLEKGTLGPSVSTLKDAMSRAEKQKLSVRAVFLQHTLGYANPVKEIREFCSAHNLLLIEDLAQSYGAKDVDGKLLGSTADAIIFSFGRDKVLDGVSGGAVLFTEVFWKKLKRDGKAWIASRTPTVYPPGQHVQKELFYPGLTQLIQSTHRIGVGKFIFKAAKAAGYITSPIAAVVDKPTMLPGAYLRLVHTQLKYITQQLTHRRKIAKTYSEAFAGYEAATCLVDLERIESDIHLRVPLLFKSEKTLQKVVAACTAQNIHLSDRWYRTVVDSGSLNYPTIYKAGDCPEAEHVSKILLNLPTHHKVTVEDAQRIALTIIKSIE